MYPGFESVLIGWSNYGYVYMAIFIIRIFLVIVIFYFFYFTRGYFMVFYLK